MGAAGVEPISKYVGHGHKARLPTLNGKRILGRPRSPAAAADQS